MTELRIRSESGLPIGSVVNVSRTGEDVRGVVTGVEDDPLAVHQVEYYTEDEGGTELMPRHCVVVVTVP